MQTISIISSISYNSLSFFELTARRLQDAGIIDWCHWIWHQPEDDERKGHIHFVLKPSKRVDTQKLRKEFVEPLTPDDVIEAVEKDGVTDPKQIPPKGVLPFQKSKIEDWLLYAIHDVRYLLKKGQSRRHHYERADVKSTEPDFLKSQWDDTADPLEVLTSRILELKGLGETWAQILQRGLVPPNQVFYWRQLYYESVTDRAGREGHENPQEGGQGDGE